MVRYRFFRRSFSKNVPDKLVPSAQQLPTQRGFESCGSPGHNVSILSRLIRGNNMPLGVSNFCRRFDRMNVRRTLEVTAASHLFDIAGGIYIQPVNGEMGHANADGDEAKHSDREEVIVVLDKAHRDQKHHNSQADR